MQRIPAGKMATHVLSVCESFVTRNSLDDVLESTLFHLLDLEHVKKI
jgi:hypothetical protein